MFSKGQSPGGVQKVSHPIGSKTAQLAGEERMGQGGKKAAKKKGEDAHDRFRIGDVDEDFSPAVLSVLRDRHQGERLFEDDQPGSASGWRIFRPR